MTRVNALAESFDIAFGFLERSGELRGAAEAANISLESIERQLRGGECRKPMLANRAIGSCRAQAVKIPAVMSDRIVIWLP